MSGFSGSWFSNGGGGSYRAVGSRCAVDLGRILIPGSLEGKREAIESVGCTIVSDDPIAELMTTARSCVWRRGARASEAPSVVDCSSFTKWIFGQAGIWIPRRSIQQRDWVGNGGHAVNPAPLFFVKKWCWMNDRDDVRTGDLVFVSGWRDYYDTDPAQGVGHVGVVTNDRTVIHAANSRLGVIESPIAEFLYIDRFRGVRRMIPTDHAVLTLETPPEREVETEDDLRWMILQRLT
ncbi:C40 family peptidase [Candidatus Uhrbacteria bacterium]|nr:C40 family peptidase [Candidatus Uhrbacteria bacterium]